jgi:hypothetical protein
MTTLTPGQIKQQAINAGFTGNDVNVAVAVALAESGGNARAHNSKPPDNSYGLWQINMLGNMGPSRRKWFKISSNEELFDPATNAKAARMIKGSSGWKAWTTYTRGTYLKHMNTAKQAVPTGEATEPDKLTIQPVKSPLPFGPDDIAGAVGGVVGAGTGITGAVREGVNAVTTGVSRSVVNVAVIMVALSMAALGIFILLRNQAATLAGPAAKAVLKGLR